jgi:hypothetical protein
LRAEEEARQQAENQARLKAEQESRERAEAVVRDRAELEARIRAEIEAKIRAEEEERKRAEAGARRRAEREKMVAEEAVRESEAPDFPFEIERSEIEEPARETRTAPDAKVTDIAEWFEVGLENRKEIVAVEPAAKSIFPEDDFGPITEDVESEFTPVSVPEATSPAPEPDFVSAEVARQLTSSKPAERAAAVSDLPRFGGEDAFRHVSAAFDDQSAEVRSAAARALFDLRIAPRLLREPCANRPRNAAARSVRLSPRPAWPTKRLEI